LRPFATAQGDKKGVIASPSLPVILRERSDRRISLRINSAKQSQLVFGIDLTSTPSKPSACLALDTERQPVYFGFLATDNDIIAIQNFYSPQVIAIDAPLSLPRGLCCLEKSCPCQPESREKNRKCDRELRRNGIRCYPTTKESFIKELIYRGIELKGKLSHEGFKVIEIYPYATKVRLFGKAIPGKTTGEGMAFLRQRLAALLPSLSPYLEAFNHDLCHAALAAYTALLCHQGRAEALGSRQEGLIFVPRNSGDE